MSGRRRILDADREVAAKIREVRMQVGLRQNQAAKAVGVTPHQFNKYEKGVTRVTAGRLLAIAKAFGKPVAAFFPTDDHPAPDGNREESNP